MRTFPTAFFACTMAFAAVPAISGTGFEPYSPRALERALDDGKAVVVHVNAPWCEVCRRQIGVLDALLAEPEFRAVRAIRIEVDLDRKAAGRLSMANESAILVIRDGDITAASLNEADVAALRKELRTGL